MAGQQHAKKRKLTHSPRKRVALQEPAPPARRVPHTLYRDFFENANDACAAFTLDGIITAVNRGAERLLGWARDELIGQHVRKVATPATVALAEERSHRFLAGDKPSSSLFAAELVRKDGSIVVVEARTRAMRDVAGRLIGYQGIYRDLTERQQAEAALRASEEYFRGLIENAADMIVILAADGTVCYSSPAGERVLGYARAVTDGKSGFDFIHPDDRSGAIATLNDLLHRPGGTWSMELRVQHQDGAWHAVEATATNLLQNPAVRGIVVNARDITQRKRLEEELRASEERYRTIFDTCPDLLYLTDPAGRILDANPAVVRWAGFSLEELRHKHFLDFFAGDNREELLQTGAALLQGGSVRELVVKARNAHGEVRNYEVNALPVRDQHGAITAILSLARDVTTRTAMEQALRDSEERYRRFVDAAPDVIYTLACDGTLTSLNPAFEQITGWRREDWLNKPFAPILHPDDVPAALDLFQQVIQGKPLPLFELHVVTPSGEYLTGEFLAVSLVEAGQVTGVLGVSRDITKRKRMEAALQESQQLTRQIADTMPDILYLYDLVAERVVYINRQIGGLGYTPEEIREKDVATLRSLLHPEDVAIISNRYRQFVVGVPDELIEAEYRVRHANGEWRWFASRATVFRRAGDGTPQQILGVAQDITERKRLERLLQERVVRPADMPERLKQFREKLGMTQPEFGRTFGGFNQRQISSYETGENDIPLELLLAIRAKGYPVDAVLGTGPLEALEKTALYFSTSHTERALACELLEAVLRLLTRDRDTIVQALRELDLPGKHFTRDEEKLLADLANLEQRRR